jgi:hypothetical protein
MGSLLSYKQGVDRSDQTLPCPANHEREMLYLALNAGGTVQKPSFVICNL